MSGLWIIEVEPWVLAHPTLRQDVWDAVKDITGVARLSDLEVVSLHTLEEWTLPRDQSLVPIRKRLKGVKNVDNGQSAHTSG